MAIFSERIGLGRFLFGDKYISPGEEIWTPFGNRLSYWYWKYVGAKHPTVVDNHTLKANDHFYVDQEINESGVTGVYYLPNGTPPRRQNIIRDTLTELRYQYFQF